MGEGLYALLMCEGQRLTLGVFLSCSLPCCLKHSLTESGAHSTGYKDFSCELWDLYISAHGAGITDI